MNQDRGPQYPDAPDYLEDLRRRYDALRFPDPEFGMPEVPASPISEEREPHGHGIMGTASGAVLWLPTVIAGKWRNRQHAVASRPAPLPVMAAAAAPAAFSLRESLFSRRRLRPLLLLGVLAVLLAATGIAWFLNQNFKRQTFAERTVVHMENAPSYNGKGVDTVTQGSKSTQVSEQYDYISPDHAHSHYLVSTAGGGFGGLSGLGGSGATDCLNREVIVLNTQRYQKCGTPGFRIQGWWSDTVDPSVFQSIAFRPWERFSWCSNIHEYPKPQTIEGVTTRVFTCQVPAKVEASRSGSHFATAADKANFIQHATITITAWVRENDGYIGRFHMEKMTPATSASATSTEVLDYVYTEFGKVPTIEAPGVGGNSSAGNTTGTTGGNGSSGSSTVAANTGNTGNSASATGGQSSGTSAGSSGSAATGSSGTPGTGATAVPTTASGQPTVAPTAVPTTSSQPDPAVNAKTVTINGHTFDVTVAADAASREQGLQLKTYLPQNQGMLFVFPSSQRWIFWMKRTLIPLDVVFINTNMQVVDVKQMQVQPGVPDDQLARYQSSQPAKYALEINGGLAEQDGFQPGMAVKLGY